MENKMSRKISLLEKLQEPFKDSSKTVEVPAFKAKNKTDVPGAIASLNKEFGSKAKTPKQVSEPEPLEHPEKPQSTPPRTKTDVPGAIASLNKEFGPKKIISPSSRMTGAGLPKLNPNVKPSNKSTDPAELKSPNLNKAYQTTRSGGKAEPENLNGPTIWRNQEKAAAAQGAHDYSAGVHSAPKATPKTPEPKTDPIASKEPQGPGSDPVASQKTSAAPTETSKGPVAVFAQGEHPLNKERQTTPRGKRVAGEPELTPPAVPPPPQKPPPVPPPQPKAAKAVTLKGDGATEEPSTEVPTEVPKGKKGSRAGSIFNKGVFDVALHHTKAIAGQAGKFIHASTRINKV